MNYAASTAYDLDRLDYGHAEPDRKRRMSVITGGGLDAKARKGVSARFIHALQIVLLFALVFFGLGAVRVAITAQTLTLLRDNASMQAQIETMSDENNNLRIERSSLASSERIIAIATGSYGMHLSAASESLTLPADIVAAAEAEPTTDAEPMAAPEAVPVSEASDVPPTIVSASME